MFQLQTKLASMSYSKFNLLQLNDGLPKFFNNTSSIDYQPSVTNPNECLMSNMMGNRDPNELYCTPEWKTAKPSIEMPEPNLLLIFGNMLKFVSDIGDYNNANNTLGLFRDLRKKCGNIVKMDNLLGRLNSVHIHNPFDSEKKLESATPERDILLSISNFHNKGLVTLSKSVHNKNDKLTVGFLKEFHKWSLESITDIALKTKLGCLQRNLPEDFVLARTIHITSEMFLENLWAFNSNSTYEKAMKIYKQQVTLNRSLIEKVIKEITDKNAIYTDSGSSAPNKLLKFDCNLAFITTLVMVIGEFDITSSTLINILYLLGTNKSIQKKIRKEIMSLLPNEDSIVAAEILNNMLYLKACYEVAVRLYLSVNKENNF